MAYQGDTKSDPSERYPDLMFFLESSFPDAEFEGISDEEAARQFVGADTDATMQSLLQQGREFLAREDAPWDWVEELANRNLGTPEEARRWLARILAAFEAALQKRDQ